MLLVVRTLGMVPSSEAYSTALPPQQAVSATTFVVHASMPHGLYCDDVAHVVSTVTCHTGHYIPRRTILNTTALLAGLGVGTGRTLTFRPWVAGWSVRR